MIFIIEQQIPVIQDKKYRKISPYREACLIYKSLTLLSHEKLISITKIHFLVTESIDEPVYKYCFSKYSADVTSYKSDKEIICEIIHEFPDIDEIEKNIKSNHIVDLINKLDIFPILAEKKQKEYVSINNNSVAPFLFYLPYCRPLSFYLLKEFTKANVELYSDKKTLKGRSSKEHIFIDINKYFVIKDNLEKIKPQIIKNEKELNSFQSKELLEYFGDEVFKRIIGYSSSRNKKIHIYGKDKFIIKKVIERMLLHLDWCYYDLPEELKNIEKKEKSVVAYNFDQLGNNEEYKYLYDKLKEFDEIYYVIVQAIRNVNSKYFSYFEEIEMPSSKDFEKSLSSIFLVLLLEKGIYIDNKRILGNFNNNLLRNMIPDVESLETLFKAINEFDDIRYNDLKNNAGFWYYLSYLVESISAKTKAPQKIKQLIRFERSGQSWEIHGLAHNISIDRKGILYLCVIILNSLANRQPLDSSGVRMFANRYMGKEIKKNGSKESDFDNLESDRKTISSAISDLKNENTILKEFIEEYFTFSSTANTFNHKDKIEVIVKVPELRKLMNIH
jgi:hypothetical protein